MVGLMTCTSGASKKRKIYPLGYYLGFSVLISE